MYHGSLSLTAQETVKSMVLSIYSMTKKYLHTSCGFSVFGPFFLHEMKLQW